MFEYLEYFDTIFEEYNSFLNKLQEVTSKAEIPNHGQNPMSPGEKLQTEKS